MAIYEAVYSIRCQQGFIQDLSATAKNTAFFQNLG